jgi:acyl CoA:acetate/3-ketoacid CoA transferase beta subunit
MVITARGVFEVGQGWLRLMDIAPEVTVEEIRSKTEAGFSVAPELKVAA